MIEFPINQFWCLNMTTHFCKFRLLAFVLGLLVLLSEAGSAFAQANPEQELVELTMKTLQQLNSGQVAEAEKTATKLQTLADRSFQNQPIYRSAVLLQVFIVKLTAEKYDEAERLGKQVVSIYEKMPGQEIGLAVALGKMGSLYLLLGRFSDAEQCYTREFTVARDAKLAEHPILSMAAVNRATIYNYQSRYAEAESWAKYGLELLKRHLSEDDALIQQALGTLAQSYEGQNRSREAETLRRQILESVEKKFGRSSVQTARPLQDMGMFYLMRHRAAEAKLYLTRSLEAYEKLGTETVMVADVTFFLAALALTEENDPERADRLFERSKAISSKLLGQNNTFSTVFNSMEIGRSLQELMNTPNQTPEVLVQRVQRLRELMGKSFNEEVKKYGIESPNVLSTALMNASLLWNIETLTYKKVGGSPPESSARDLMANLISVADKIVEKHPSHPVVLSNLGNFHDTKAAFEWSRKLRESALEHLRTSMKLVEEQSSSLSGNEHDQASFLAKIVSPYHRMVAWQSELGADANLAEAFDALERARARTLLVQLDLKGVDLLRKIPESQAASLRARRVESQSLALEMQNQLSRIGSRTDLSAAEKERRVAELTGKLSEAQNAYVNVTRDIRNASPDYQFAQRQARSVFEWRKLQPYLASQRAVLLEYLTSDFGDFVLLADHEGNSSLTQLTFSEEQRRDLGLPYGGFGKQLNLLLQGLGPKSLMETLHRPENSPAAAKILSELWKVLIPESIRVGLQQEKYQLMIVVPDGSLTLLPFETLVVQASDPPQYLLDVGPPILYAQSMTVLSELESRPNWSKKNSKKAPVLTVGNPSYPVEKTADSKDLLASASSRGVYRFAGGKLNALPFTGKESTWIEQVFRKQQIACESFQGAAATEAAIRSAVVGRKIVHLACHGLIDQAYGNLFGALAVTPGSNTSLASDDGFITLAELYEMDLRGCELMILSACETNFGPQQRGEGTWALTRGALVAGAKRVVASNWLVDDEAAASLISYYCGGLANDLTKEKPQGYATRLHKAKRWIREQTRWSHPFYWASFVMVGPN